MNDQTTNDDAYNPSSLLSSLTRAEVLMSLTRFILGGLSLALTSLGVEHAKFDSLMASATPILAGLVGFALVYLWSLAAKRGLIRRVGVRVASQVLFDLLPKIVEQANRNPDATVVITHTDAVVPTVIVPPVNANANP